MLEIGFGPGVGLVALAGAQSDVQVVGIDPSSALVAAAWRRVRRFGQRVRVHEGAASALPRSDGACDAVCATNNVQLWQLRAESLAETLSVPPPGGLLVLSVHERAVLPQGGSAGAGFDAELLPELEEVGFADSGAG